MPLEKKYIVFSEQANKNIKWAAVGEEREVFQINLKTWKESLLELTVQRPPASVRQRSSPLIRSNKGGKSTTSSHTAHRFTGRQRHLEDKIWHEKLTTRNSPLKGLPFVVTVNSMRVKCSY